MNTRQLLAFCLLGFAAPAVAQARPPEPPRCTPQAPSTTVDVQPLTKADERPTSLDRFTSPDPTSRGLRSIALDARGRLHQRVQDAWKPVRTPDGRFVDTDARWLLGQDGQLYRSEGPIQPDAPATWSPIGAPVPGATVVRHLLQNGAARLAVVGGADGIVLHSTVDGAAWQATAPASPGGAPIVDIASGPWRYADPSAPTVAEFEVVFVVADAEGRVWSARWAPGTDVVFEAVSELSDVVGLPRTPAGWLAVERTGRTHRLTIPLDGSIAVSETTGQSAPFPEPAIDVTLTRVEATGWGWVGTTDRNKAVRQVITVHHEPGHPCGRPFEVGGEVRTTRSHSQGAPLTSLAAATWLVDAEAEHASIASFARFILRLMALGAPTAFLMDAQSAMADEIRHADACYRLASRFAGTPLRPGTLATHDALESPSTLEDVAVEVLREGAVGETLGAALAAARLADATDPEVVETLQTIARDEAVHAQMAWRFLAWAAERGGAPLRERLAAEAPGATARARSDAGVLQSSPGVPALGVLPTSATQRVVETTLAEVVEPCVARLLEGSSTRVEHAAT